MNLKKILLYLLFPFMPTRMARRRLRFLSKNPVSYYLACVRFVRERERCAAVRTLFARRIGNLIVAGGKGIYKFPAYGRDASGAAREKRIMDAFRKISPIKIPKIELMKWNGITVQKIEPVKNARPIKKEVPQRRIGQNREKIARQMAEFLHAVGAADPVEIRDLKPDPKQKPGLFYGWNHGDLGGNFLINPETMDVAAVIDWEHANFGDMRPDFLNVARTSRDSKLGQMLVMGYAEIFNKVKKMGSFSCPFDSVAVNVGQVSAKRTGGEKACDKSVAPPKKI